MKTPAPWAIALLTAVSSPAGRWARIIGGPAVIVGAIVAGGWALVLAPIGAMMLVTGILNICPVGPLLGRPAKGDELILSFQRVDAVSVKS